MNRNTTIIIALAIGLLLLYVGSKVFKIQKIPDHRWYSEYNYQSKEPFGAWMFNSMIKHHFDSSKVAYHYQDTLVYEIEEPNHLYIYIGAEVNLSKPLMDSLYNFVRVGNDAFLIGEEFNYKYDYNEDWTVDDYEEEYQRDSFGIASDWYKYSNSDSILNVVFREQGDSTLFSYSSYFGSFKKKERIAYNTFDIDYTPYPQNIGDIGECADPMFVKLPFGEGNIYLHAIPQMFSNIGSKQDYYLEHFNLCFNRFDPELVIMDHQSFDRLGSWTNIDSPIQYILSDRSLKAAYYLLLLSCLIFVLFKSKRKQRAIPISEKNYNTSLEYVQTLSNLFASHEQPALLLPHLKKYFYHTVKTKYFIEEKNPDFVKLLSKKSKITEDEISIIVKMMNGVESRYEFPRDQLFNLHRRVEKFYKNAI